MNMEDGFSGRIVSTGFDAHFIVLVRSTNEWARVHSERHLLDIAGLELATGSGVSGVYRESQRSAVAGTERISGGIREQ